MKTLTIEQFEKLITMPIWEHKKETVITNSDDECTHGVFVVESTAGDITIYYRQGWSYEEYNPYSFKIYTMDGGAWATEGFRVVDSNGEDLPGYEFLELLEGIYQPEFARYEDTREYFFDYQPLGSCTYTDELDVHYVEMHNRPSIKFTGDCLGWVGANIYVNNEKEYSPDSSASVGRWTQCRLYKTTDGKYVCLTVHGSNHQDEQPNYRMGDVCDRLEQVYEFFGCGELARKLYECCGIGERV